MDALENMMEPIEEDMLPPEIPPIAYIRPVKNGAAVLYAVCAADGTQLALFDSEDAAYYTAKQHDLEATLIH